MSYADTEVKIITFEEELDRHGILVFPCSGSSMLPLLRPGKDLVIIKKKQNQRCKKYDVILYKREDKYILHRIIKVCSNDYVLIGDHQYIKENGITDNQIVGVLDAVVRSGKEIPVTNWKYQLYSHLWCDLLPVRAFILKIKAFLSNMKRQ